MDKHRIPIGCIHTSRTLTPQEKALSQDVTWHNVTPRELIFIKTYYLAKNRVLSGAFISASVVIFLIEVVMAISGFGYMKHILWVTTLLLLVSFIVFEAYMHTWQNLTLSATCTYVPIYSKYQLKSNCYAVIIVDGKKHTYRIESLNDCCNHVMVVNYKGLSCAINSKVFPN